MRQSLPAILGALLLAFVSSSCLDEPSNHQIETDFLELFELHGTDGLRPQVRSVRIEEGDSAAVYLLVTFDVVVERTMEVEFGWFGGRTFLEGSHLRDGTLELQ